jgi:hypothetical protein
MNIVGKDFGYMRQTVPNLSDDKLQEYIFTEQQISRIVKYELFENLLAETEKPAQLTF